MILNCVAKATSSKYAVCYGIGGGVLVFFSDKQIAFYGTSGVVYALGGFSLSHLMMAHAERRKFEWLAILLGVSTLIQVVTNVVTDPYFTVHWVNGGHLSGFIIGILAGLSRLAARGIRR